MKIKNYKLKIQQEYKPSEIEPYWQKVWEETGLYQADIKRSKKLFGKTQGKPFDKAQGKQLAVNIEFK